MKTQLRNKAKTMSRRKAEIILSIGFTMLMFILTWSEIVYIPISETRTLDLSLVPVIFASMIGGYVVAILVGIGWVVVSAINHLGELYDWYWFIGTKLIFSIVLVHSYSICKIVYPRSPWNVYRTIILAVTARHMMIGMAMAVMFPDVPPQEWMRDNVMAYIIELSISLLAMSLLIEKLRQVHILNGVRRKKKSK